MSARRTLTAAQMAGLKDEGVFWVAPSLYLQVRPGQGTRSWLFRYSRNNTNQWMGLGSTEEKPFTEARDEAALLRVEVKRGADPIAAKREVEAKRIVEQQPKLQASMSVPSNTSPATRAAGRTTSTSPSGRAPLPPTVVPSSVRPPSTRSVSRMCSRS